MDTVKTCLKRPLKKKTKKIGFLIGILGQVWYLIVSIPDICAITYFKADYRLMHVKSIAECSKWSILQYFRPSLSYHLFCLFLSGA